jgi:hypothetical protein
MAIHERWCENAAVCNHPFSRRYRRDGRFVYLCPDCAAKSAPAVDPYRRGATGTHRRIVDPVTGRPERVRITRVAKGVLYYRVGPGRGTLHSCGVEEADRWIELDKAPA